MRRHKVKRTHLSVRWIQNVDDLKKGTLWITASIRMFGVRWAYTVPLYVDLNGFTEDVRRLIRKHRNGPRI